ncbi:MAG: V-type ATP synthase subunit D [Syntrophorhabdaceae bacterium]
MRLAVNPTRMELLKLRRRLVVARRGHKLLKDKLDGLIKEFMNIAREYRELRQTVDDELPYVMKLFVLAEITSSRAITENALESVRQELDIKVLPVRLMGVRVQKLEIQYGDVTGRYSLVHTSAELDMAIAKLREFLPKLLAMAQMEDMVRRLSSEVEKTRRRVNALEHTFIPRIQETIRFITSKLEETERSATSALMKIKSQRLAQREY